MYEFVETQRFRQWWVWLVLILAATVPVVSIFVSGSSSERTSAVVSLVVGIGVPAITLGFVLSIKLRTRITSVGVSYQFFPIHLKDSTILWNEIEKVEIRKYQPIKEYGGWGWRHSFQNGRAFNVSGNTGLQLVLKTGKKILIGTQKEEEMRAVLNGLGRL